MTLSPGGFRDAVAQFPSGVTIVTVTGNNDKHGMTASSFASVSLDPPLVLISLDKSSRTRRMITEAGSFAVNILSAGQENVARMFARSGDKTFEELPHRLGPQGAPLLEGVVGWLECQTREVADGGDHDVFIARVLAAGAPGGAPLVYQNRSYRRLRTI